MKIMSMMALLFLVIGCTKKDASKPTIEKNLYKATINAQVSSYIYRIENDEVICYTKRHNNGGMFCKFK